MPYQRLAHHLTETRAFVPPVAFSCDRLTSPVRWLHLLPQTTGCPQLISDVEAMRKANDTAIPGNVIHLVSEGPGEKPDVLVY